MSEKKKFKWNGRTLIESQDISVKIKTFQEI